MVSTMASGTFRLNGRFFDEKKLIMNKHRLAQFERLSYPTVHKYIYKDDLHDNYDVRKFSGDVLFAILRHGMGYSVEEIKQLKVGDLFEVLEEASK